MTVRGPRPTMGAGENSIMAATIDVLCPCCGNRMKVDASTGDVLKFFVNGQPAGDYEHDVNPDLRYSSNSLSVNTNLTNRLVLSADASLGNADDRVLATVSHSGALAKQAEEFDRLADAVALHERANAAGEIGEIGIRR